MKWAMWAIALVLATSETWAQGLTFAGPNIASPTSGRSGIYDGLPVDPSNTYLRTLVPSGAIGAYEEFIKLSDFYAYVPGSTSANSVALAGIAARLDRFTSRFRESIALAGAINVLPSEPGRRLNISVGGAGYDGAGAASIAVSARINEDTIGYVGVARGTTQTLVKGGIGWSPW